MTTLNRLIGYGIQLGVDITGGTTFVNLASIISPPSGPGAKVEKVDVTILSDKVKQWRAAQVDGGSYTFKVQYDPADATTTTLTGLLSSGAVANWQISYPSGTPAAQTFLGIITGFDRKMAGANERVEADIEITVSSSTVAGLGI